jgi:hypothetical protein
MSSIITTLLAVSMLVLVLAATAHAADQRFGSSAWWQEMDRDGRGGRP